MSGSKLRQAAASRRIQFVLITPRRRHSRTHIHKIVLPNKEPLFHLYYITSAILDMQMRTGAAPRRSALGEASRRLRRSSCQLIGNFLMSFILTLPGQARLFDIFTIFSPLIQFALACASTLFS